MEHLLPSNQLVVFIASQIDYGYFLYGLAFLWISVTVVALRSTRDTQFPWHWLGSFAAFVTVSAWVGVWGALYPEKIFFEPARYFFLLCAYTSLIEFIRGSLSPFNIRQFPFAVTAIIFVVGTILLALFDQLGQIVVRAILGPASGFLMAWFVWKYRNQFHPGSQAMRGAFISIIGMAASLLLVVPVQLARSSMYSLDADFFEAIVNMLRSLFALGIAAFFYRHYLVLRSDMRGGVVESTKWRTLVTSVGPLLIVAIGGIFFVHFVTMYGRTVETDDHVNRLQQVTQSLERDASLLKLTMVSVSRSAGVADYTATGKIYSELRLLVSVPSLLFGDGAGYVIGKDGKVLISSDEEAEEEGEDYAGQDFFKNAFRGKADTYITQDELNEDSALYFSMPLLQGEEKVGVIAGRRNIPFESILGFLGNYVIDERGKVLASSNVNMIGKRFGTEFAVGNEDLTEARINSVSQEQYTINGKRVRLYVLPLSIVGTLFASFGVAETETLLRSVSFMMLMVVSLLTIAVYFWLLRDEEARDASRSAELMLRDAFNHINGAVLIHRVDGTIVDVNDGFASMYSVGRDAIVGENVAYVLGLSESQREEIMGLWRKAKDGEDQQTSLTISDVKVPGNERILEINMSRIQFQNDTLIITTLYDATLRRKAEARIAESEARLRERNEELEQLNKVMLGREIKMTELKEQLQKNQPGA